MKKLNENTKVTLTLGQLKKLVKESLEDGKDHPAYAEIMKMHDEDSEKWQQWSGGHRTVYEISVNDGTDSLTGDFIEHLVWGHFLAAKKAAKLYLQGRPDCIVEIYKGKQNHFGGILGMEKPIWTCGEHSRELGESTASGPTCEESLDQISADAQKAKEAYLNGENSEASDIVFKIIKDAKNVSNRLTETTGGPLMESNQGLIDQVLEDPRVQMAAEQFVNCLIETVVTAPNAPMLSDVISSADDIRWKRVVSAINLVKMNYKGAK